MNDMELRQLRYFAAVAEHEHFTRAAASLNVAQPALSQQVRRLERELGVELFERTSRRVRLSQAGRALLPGARAALMEVEAIETGAQALRGVTAGRVTIGAMQSLGPLDLSGLIAAFHARHPAVDIALREASTREMIDLLEAGELDLAFLTRDERLPETLRAHDLFSEDLMAIVAPGHRLAGRAATRLSALRDDPFVYFKAGTGLRHATDRLAREAGFDPAVRFETNELARVRALVARGLGVAVVPRSEAERPGPRVAALALRPATRRAVAIAWRAGGRPAPAPEAFLALALERAPQTAARPSSS